MRSTLNRQTFGAFASILLVAAIGGWLYCGRSPSLEERIKTTASRLKNWPVSDTIPKLYEQEVIDLAREPTGDLKKAFRSLDAERSEEPMSALDKALVWLHAKRPPPTGDRPPNDKVWLTGTLITILAFDCPPVKTRDWPTWHTLKSQLTGDPNAIMRSPAGDKFLAEWPWSHDHGSWHLLSIYTIMYGPSDGRIALLFEYYQSHFKRRQLP